MKSDWLGAFTAVLATVAIALPLGATSSKIPERALNSPDINGDGTADVIIEALTGGSVGFIIGYQLNGTALTGSPSAGPIPGSYGNFVTIGYADVNGDRITDKIMELRDGGAADGYTVAILLEPDFASPTASELPASYGTSAHVGFADVNGDGVMDRIIEADTTGTRQTAAIVFDGVYAMASLGTGDLEFGEKARLAAILHSGALDPVPDEHFDRITRMAARVFDVPIAMATIIDSEHIWIKSSVGFEPTCLRRADGLCETVVETGQLVHRNDARQHPISKLHPLVDCESGVVF